MPCFSISSEDTVAKERLPPLMEWLPLAMIIELGGKNCLDVLRICGEDEALPEYAELNCL